MQFYKLEIRSIEHDRYNSRREGERQTTLSLLASMLSSRAEDLQIGYRDSGQPYLLGREELHLSISHTEDFVAVYLADEPIGIDIEMIGGQVERVQAKFLNEQEQELLNDFSDDYISVLHLCWSAKEACYKCWNPPERVITAFKIIKLELIAPRVFRLSLQYQDRIFLVRGEVYSRYVLCYSIGITKMNPV